MKARIKATGEVIDIITITDPGIGDQKVYTGTDRCWYREHDLDFSVDETKEAEGEVLSGWDKGVDFALSHQWVSTKERMPEPRSLVLVYVEGYPEPIDLAIWRDRYNCWHDEYDEEFLYCAKEVKFWMPIPAIPQLNPEK